MRPRADLNILCWQGYDAAEVLNPFASQHDISIHAETLLSDAGTAQRLVAGEVSEWDVLNINNAYIRDYLYLRNLIRPLAQSRFQPYFESLLPQYQRLYKWAYSHNGDLIGICQRFGAFNLVVNTKHIDRHSAEDQGFDLANQAKKPYGILLYDDFNIMHICIGAGLNPFVELNDDELDKFTATATQWLQNASLVTDDHTLLNKALIGGGIDFYLSGGVYTVSTARLAGYQHLQAVTPSRGPIDGLGGIVFTEITSCLQHNHASLLAEDFLEYLLQPEVSIQIAFSEGTCNPVAQMGDSKVFAKFSAEQLNAIQWDTLEEDISRCADYHIPPNHSVLLQRLQIAKQESLGG